MGFLSGIVDVASHAVEPTLQVAAARQQGIAAANRQQQQELLQQYVWQRQAERDAQQQALSDSVMARNRADVAHISAQTNALQHPPAKILRGPGGQLVDVTNPANATPVGPAPIATRVKVVQPDGSVVFVDPNNPPPGLKQRVGTRGPGGAGTLDTELNHTINNVRAQIGETERERNALDKTIQAGTALLATPDAKQAGLAAALRKQQLQQRLDSLNFVHDRLIQQQQRTGGFAVPVSPTQPTAPTNSPYRLTPDQSSAMGNEFDAASQDLQTLLNSNAPPNVKAQARALYDTHQRQVARKYHATAPTRP